MIRALHRISNRYIIYGLGTLAAVIVLGVAGLNAQSRVLAQAADSLYVTPASGSYGVGSSFTVSVRENSSTQVNAVQADLTYSSNLQFVSIDASGSAFGIDASSTGGGGSVSTARGTITPVSGDQLVTKITFKVLSAGTGTITMQNSSVVLSSSTNSDVLNSRNGGSYSLQAAPAGTPAASPPATPASPQAAVSPTRKPSTSLPSTTIAPQGSAQATALPGDTTIELESPATVVTTPDPTRNVTKVEYLLNGRVVATDTEAPYTHSIDTTKYRNGTYTLTTKTYYNDGKFDTSNASLVVKNKFGPYQLWLQLRHYAWIVVILLIIVAELVYLKFFRRGGKPASGGPMFGGPGSGTVGSPSATPPANTIQPTVVAGPVVTPTQPGPAVAPPTTSGPGVETTPSTQQITSPAETAKKNDQQTPPSAFPTQQ